MRLTKSYCVARYVFSLTMDADSALWESLDNYAPFEIAACEAPDPVFSVEMVDELDFVGKKELYLSRPEDFEQRIDIHTITDGYLFEMAPFGDVPVAGWLKVSEDFSRGWLKAGTDAVFCINNALMLVYAFRTAGMMTIEMHSSVTVKDGKGYLFLGKSGTGKSTHSRLWLKNIPGTHLLNDDNPVVRVIDGKARVFGTPWSGKTPCYINEDYPVGAIVRICREKFNRCDRISLPEAFASVSSSSSGLRAIRSIGDGLFATISSVVMNVPCYKMNCLPDDNAAVVCCGEVTKENG